MSIATCHLRLSDTDVGVAVEATRVIVGTVCVAATRGLCDLSLLGVKGGASGGTCWKGGQGNGHTLGKGRAMGYSRNVLRLIICWQ